MKRISVKILSCLVTLFMIFILTSGCTTQSIDKTKDTTKEVSIGDTSSTDQAEKKYEKTLTIDLFSEQSNYQGIQSGWFGKIVKDKFNMEINIIARNVAGGGETLFQTRSAAGNLGDIVMIGSEDGKLTNTVRAGLLLDITDMVNKSENISKYSKGTDNIKNLINSDKIYAIPSKVSSSSPLTPSEGLDLTYGPYIRWDIYTAIGSPKISTQEELLPILKNMQEKFPTSDSGKKTYGISLFKDWDDKMMCLAKQPACMYGYDENGFQLLSADGKTTQSIIDSDSEYVRALMFYFKANQMGILDPDSTTQNYDTLYEKYKNGQVLWSPWPWLCQAAYNTVEHKVEGKGFMLAPMEDMKIFSYGCNPTGQKYVVGVGSKAKDPQRMVDFIDWLYSPEGIMMSCAQTSNSCGPEGLTWEMKDGKPVLTDFGKKVFHGDAEIMMPDGWGNGTYKDGYSQLNFQTVNTLDINPVNNAPYNYTLWESVLAENSTPLDNSWKEVMKATTALDYLKQHDNYVVSPGNGFIPGSVPTQIDTVRTQIKAIIVSESWRMVFAKDEAEFNSVLENMQNTVKGLGYDEVLAYDQKISDQYRDARAAALIQEVIH